MFMPEATMDKYRDVPAMHDDVWRSGQVHAMEAVSIAFKGESLAHQNFRLRILAAYAGHHPAARF